MGNETLPTKGGTVDRHVIGEGVPQDYVKAHTWFNLSASGAHDSEVRARATEGRDRVAARMTREQIAEAQRLASPWVPK